MVHTHQTAPTQLVEANSIRFAYRRFGKTGGVPLVLSQHYIGAMDYWDPTVTDGLARDRVIEDRPLLIGSALRFESCVTGGILRLGGASRMNSFSRHIQMLISVLCDVYLPANAFRAASLDHLQDHRRFFCRR
jgi:hypothetical protein